MQVVVLDIPEKSRERQVVPSQRVSRVGGAIRMAASITASSCDVDATAARAYTAKARPGTRALCVPTEGAVRHEQGQNALRPLQ